MPQIRTALLGLGGMGGGLAARLLEQGFPVTVWNRTQAKAEALAELGAVVAGDPAHAVRGADVVLVSLSDEAAVEDVLFERALAELPAGAVVLDATTTSPAYAKAATARLREAGFDRLETCLLGNPMQARTGQLRVLVSGDPATLARVRPVADALGHEVRYVGPPGNASATKLAFNALLGAQVVALAEVVDYGERAGLDPQALLGAIAASGFSSKVLSFRAEIMKSGRYEPAAFRSTLMAKDLRLAVEAGAEAGAAMPMLAEASSRFAELTAAGYGDWDAAALLEFHRAA